MSQPAGPGADGPAQPADHDAAESTWPLPGDAGLDAVMTTTGPGGPASTRPPDGDADGAHESADRDTDGSTPPASDDARPTMRIGADQPTAGGSTPPAKDDGEGPIRATDAGGTGPTPRAISDPDLAAVAAHLRVLASEATAGERVLRAAAEGRYLDAAALLDRAPGLLARIGPAARSVAELLDAPARAAAIEAGAQRTRRHYRAALEQALDAAGIERTGQWPSYTIGDIVRLEIDLARGLATLEARRLGTLEPSAVVELVGARLAEVLDRPFDSGAFVAALGAAHAAVARAEGPTAGEYADIRAVYAHLRDARRAAGGDARRYSETAFGIDLYRLLRHGATHDGWRIELSPAQSAAAGLFVPMRGGGNYIAAIRITRHACDG